MSFMIFQCNVTKKMMVLPKNWYDSRHKLVYYPLVSPAELERAIVNLAEPSKSWPSYSVTVVSKNPFDTFTQALIEASKACLSLYMSHSPKLPIKTEIKKEAIPSDVEPTNVDQTLSPAPLSKESANTANNETPRRRDVCDDQTPSSISDSNCTPQRNRFATSSPISSDEESPNVDQTLSPAPLSKESANNANNETPRRHDVSDDQTPSTSGSNCTPQGNRFATSSPISSDEESTNAPEISLSTPLSTESDDIDDAHVELEAQFKELQIDKSKKNNLPSSTSTNETNAGQSDSVSEENGDQSDTNTEENTSESDTSNEEHSPEFDHEARNHIVSPRARHFFNNSVRMDTTRRHELVDVANGRTRRCPNCRLNGRERRSRKECYACERGICDEDCFREFHTRHVPN